MNNDLFQHGKKSLLSSLFRLLARQTGQLLSPPMSVCLGCGSIRQSGGLSRQPAKDIHSRELPLCDRCRAQISWVEQIHCPVCGRPGACPDCPRRTETHFVCNRSAVLYSAEMKEWLARYKYRGDERMAELFARMLHVSFRRLAAEIYAQGVVPHVVSFVPLSRERLAERGFNQAEQMAKGLGKLTGLPVIPLLIRTRHTDKQSKKSREERIRGLDDTFVPCREGVLLLERLAGRSLRKPEYRSPAGPLPEKPDHFFRADRPSGTTFSQNSTFSLTLSQVTASSGLLRSVGGPVHILLVDDVYTTGSTLNQCAKALVSALHVRVYGLTWARS
jgi:predicted amidophosphoribosyltransferase